VALPRDQTARGPSKKRVAESMRDAHGLGQQFYQKILFYKFVRNLGAILRRGCTTKRKNLGR
jgi:hypothetical protein